MKKFLKWALIVVGGFVAAVFIFAAIDITLHPEKVEKSRLEREKAAAARIESEQTETVAEKQITAKKQAVEEKAPATIAAVPKPASIPPQNCTTNGANGIECVATMGRSLAEIEQKSRGMMVYARDSVNGDIQELGYDNAVQVIVFFGLNRPATNNDYDMRLTWQLKGGWGRVNAALDGAAKDLTLLEASDIVGADTQKLLPFFENHCGARLNYQRTPTFCAKVTR